MIGRCLDSLVKQTVPCSEMIVVDRFSSDGTPKIAEAFGARVIQSNGNRSVARNLGMAHSRSSAVLFIDSDMILSPTLLEECKKGLGDHDALIIPEISQGTGFWAKCKSAERRTYQGNDAIEAARCFRKSPLLLLGGYNPRLEAGEDWELQNRVRTSGLSLGRIQAKIVHDDGDLSLAMFVKKKYAYGGTMREYLTTNPNASIKQVNPLYRIVTTTLKILPCDPIHGTGVLILKTLEFAAAGLGHLTEFIISENSLGPRGKERESVHS